MRDDYSLSTQFEEEQQREAQRMVYREDDDEQMKPGHFLFFMALAVMTAWLVVDKFFPLISNVSTR